jgi:hypothetical protein
LIPLPLTARLRPSPVLASLLVVVHALALYAAGVTLEGWSLGFAAAGLMLSALGTTGEALLYWQDSATGIELREDGRFAWQDRLGHWHEAELADGGYVSPWLIVVPLVGTGRRRKWVVIAPDAAFSEERRRLRAWLRWRRTTNTHGDK